MLKVTYILGAGRSGSTLLERLLASAPDAAALGEVATLWRRPLAELTCSCGAPAPECPFWTETRARAGITEAVLAELARLEAETVRHRRLIRDGLSGRRWVDAPDARRFVEIQADLFGAAAEVAGATRIIDSSKAGPRAWALSDLVGVSVIHLRRRPADVVASWRRVKHDPSLAGPMRRPGHAAAAADWLTAEISARRLARRRPVVRLDYEALARDPAAAIARLGPLAKGVRVDGRRFAPDPNYHSLNGNPDRFLRGEIEIKPTPAPALGRVDGALARLTGAALTLAAP